MENAVIFTGLPRMPERFKQSIKELGSLRNQGLVNQIVFATWRGRLDTNLRRFLQNHDVEIVEKKEALEGGPGNIWHQMRALDHGLEVVPANRRVLKTRSDVQIEKEFLEILFSGRIEEMNKETGSEVFEERIWVPAFEISSPFYICDYCFFGYKKDIRKLIHYDSRYEFLYHTEKLAPAEVTRFIDPYKEKHPFLEKYLLYYRHDRGWNCISRPELMESRVKSDVYSKFLSIYYKAMREDFYVDYSPVTFQNIDEREQKFIANPSKTLMQNLKKGPLEGEHSVFCYQSKWLDSWFDDETGEDASRIVNGVQQSFNRWEGVDISYEDIMNDVSRDQEYFHELDYPNGAFVKFVTENILEPTGTTENAATVFRKISHSKYIRRLSKIRS